MQASTLAFPSCFLSSKTSGKGQNPTSLHVCTVLLFLPPLSYFSQTFWKPVSASCLLHSQCILCVVLHWKQSLYLRDECAPIGLTEIPTQPPLWVLASEHRDWYFLLPSSGNCNSTAVIMYVLISSRNI